MVVSDSRGFNRHGSQELGHDSILTKCIRGSKKIITDVPRDQAAVFLFSDYALLHDLHAGFRRDETVQSTSMSKLADSHHLRVLEVL